MIGRSPQLPAASGRLVFWEQTRRWSQLFLNRLQGGKVGRRESGNGSTFPAFHPSPLTSHSSTLLVEQAVFVTSRDELLATVESHPASFIFAEVTTAHFRELPGQIPQLRRTMPLLHIAIVCFELLERPVDEYNVLDSLFREAGAIAVLATQRDLHATIPTVLTHFAALPQLETDWRETIERLLPWRNL